MTTHPTPEQSQAHIDGWSHDIDEAPRGKTITISRTIKGELREVEEHRREYILAVHPDHTVVMTSWIPAKYTQSGKLLEGNRWSGFNVGSDPIAWAPWPTYSPSTTQSHDGETDNV